MTSVPRFGAANASLAIHPGATLIGAASGGGGAEQWFDDASVSFNIIISGGRFILSNAAPFVTMTTPGTKITINADSIWQANTLVTVPVFNHFAGDLHVRLNDFVRCDYYDIVVTEPNSIDTSSTINVWADRWLAKDTAVECGSGSWSAFETPGRAWFGGNYAEAITNTLVGANPISDFFTVAGHVMLYFNDIFLGTNGSIYGKAAADGTKPLLVAHTIRSRGDATQALVGDPREAGGGTQTELRIKGATFIGPTNRDPIFATNGLMLDGCVILAGSGATNGIRSASATVVDVGPGGLLMNRPPNANISFKGGAVSVTNGLTSRVMSQIQEGSTTLSNFAASGLATFTFNSPSIGQVVAFHNGTTLTNLTFGGGVTDGDKGDITVSASGATWTIDNDAVTFAKIQNITTARLLGRATAGSGDMEEITLGTGLSFAGTTLNSTLGDVTAAANFSTDNVLIRSDGTLKGVQASAATMDDSGNLFLSTLTSTNMTNYGAYTAVGTNQAFLMLMATNGSGYGFSTRNATRTNVFIVDAVGMTAGQALVVDNVAAAGPTNLITLTNGTVSGSPGGSTTQVQYNNAGVFDGASGIVVPGSSGETNLNVTGLHSTFNMLVTNTFTGIGTGNNGIDNLKITNNADIRTNIAVIDIATNELVLNQYYTNTARRAFVGVSVQLTAAAAGTAKVSLWAEYSGTITNVISVSAGPLASLVTIEPLLMLIGPNCRYYLTNQTSGTGASVSVLNGTSTVSGL